MDRINKKELAIAACNAEGGVRQVNIADMQQVLAIFCELLQEFEDAQIIEMVRRPIRREEAKRGPQAGARQVNLQG